MKIITDLHLVPGLRICGAIPPLPQMPLWHSQGHFMFYYVFSFRNGCYFENLIIIVSLTRAGYLLFVQNASSSPVLTRIEPGRWPTRPHLWVLVCT